MYNPIVNNYIYKKLLTFMVSKQYLTGYTPNVRVSDNNYIVDYEIGECVYSYRKMGRRIKQDVLQLIKCDMWKVITEINEKSPLKEGDLNNLNMEIRENSLYHVEMFIKRGDLHQQHDSSTT